ncbi:hypothetical protein [Actinoallomurus iriomotensis]|uniref:DUF2637 domain-containing protein n=1 Tax=Actinoallomurus iriomotensis TaxID=478107 RepID=A0A9W6VW31_9ACTN|nr:hypothetical protein [Actinoallomurus iriomotensis]GLY81804.1 hypothetical protein Airi01_100710 [Actinoallomurus iriomotensis]
MAEPTGIARPHVNPGDVASYAADHPVIAAIVAVPATIIIVVILWRTTRAASHILRQTLAKSRPESVLTFVVAGMATATSSQAMWHFFGDKLGVENVYMRAVMFSMYEAAMLVCALRARRAVKRSGQAGVEGKAVWALAGLSGSLAATDEQGFGAGLARLAAPLVAAFLWERGLSEEREAAGKRRSLNWRISPERILVWLGVAEATGQTTDQVDAQRRLTRVALAVQRVRALDRSGGKGRLLRLAEWRLNSATRAAVRYADLATDADRQETLLAQIAMLSHARALAEIEPAAPWGQLASSATRTAKRVSRSYRVAPDPELQRATAELYADLNLPFETPDDLSAWLDEDRVPVEDVPVLDEDGPVPPAFPEADEHQLKAARIFADHVQRGKVPGIRPIKKQLGVAQPKAQEVRAYLEALVNA